MSDHSITYFQVLKKEWQVSSARRFVRVVQPKHFALIWLIESRVREDHLRSDLDQRSRSDKWSRSFFPKDHFKRKDQDLDQDHPKRSLSCILKMETYTQFGRRLPPEMQASSGRKMTATDGRTGYSVISDISYFITYFVTLMSSEISFPNYVEKPSFH